MTSDVQRYSIEELLRDYLDARSSLIGHTSGDMDGDYRRLRSDGQARATAVGVEWRETLLPLHVREALAEADGEHRDCSTGYTTLPLTDSVEIIWPCGLSCTLGNVGHILYHENVATAHAMLLAEGAAP